jgi:hypothetical protein
MRLSEFLQIHSDQILQAWDEFAGTVTHTGQSLDQKALRDHAAQILSTIAADLDRPQSDAQQLAKSRGEAQRNPTVGDSAAETHADARIDAGFAVDAMITEYRALRDRRLLTGAGRDGVGHSHEAGQPAHHVRGGH